VEREQQASLKSVCLLCVLETSATTRRLLLLHLSSIFSLTWRSENLKPLRTIKIITTIHNCYTPGSITTTTKTLHSTTEGDHDHPRGSIDPYHIDWHKQTSSQSSSASCFFRTLRRKWRCLSLVWPGWDDEQCAVGEKNRKALWFFFFHSSDQPSNNPSPP